MEIGESFSARQEREARQRIYFPELAQADVPTVLAIDAIRRKEGRPLTSFGEALDAPNPNDWDNNGDVIGDTQPQGGGFLNGLMNFGREAAREITGPARALATIPFTPFSEEARDSVADSAGSAMELLSRPAAGVRSYLGAGNEPASPFSPAGLDRFPVRPGREAARGFIEPDTAPTGMDIGAIQALPDSGPELGPVHITPRTVGAFAYDAATDPLSYVGAGEGARALHSAENVAPAAAERFGARVGGGAARDAESMLSPDAAGSASQRLFGIKAPEQGLSKADELLNELKTTLGVGVPADDVATPIMRERARVKQIVDSQSARMGAVADDTVRVFETDRYGRIASLPGSPTIQDVAARLPQYEQYLSNEQRMAMSKLRAEVEPFSDALLENGIDLRSRADVQDGGFYLPRGNAALEGVDEPLKVGTGRGGAGGRKGFEKGATFDSMAEGLDAGYRYAAFKDAIQGYAKDAGDRAINAYAANAFKATGLGESAADRINPALRGRVETLRQQISSKLATLGNQDARLGAQSAEAERVSALATRDTQRADNAIRRFFGAMDRRVENTLRGDLPTTAESRVRSTRDLPTHESITKRLEALTKQIEFDAAGQPRRNAANTARIQTLGRLYAQQDVRAALDAAGGNTIEALGYIDQAAERIGTYNQAYLDPANRMRMRNVTPQQSRSGGNPFARAGDAPESVGEPAAVLKAHENALQQFRTTVKTISRLHDTDGVVKAADREFQVLARVATRSNRAARQAGERVEAGTARRASTNESLRGLRSELDGIKGEWERAKTQAMQTPRDQGSIGLTGLQGTTFPDEIANVANKFLNAEKSATGAGTGALNVVTAFNGLMRGLRASVDLSFMGIQGLLGAASHPIAYSKALGVALKSLGDERAMGAFISHFDEGAKAAGRLDSRAWAAHGAHIGGSDTEFAIGKGVAKIGSALQHGNIPGTRFIPGVDGLNPIRGSNRAFGTFGDALRLLTDDAIYGAKQSAGRVVTPDELREIAHFGNLSTGYANWRVGGDTGQLVEFAPRFFASQLELVARGLAGGGIVGSEARKSLSKLIGTGVLITVGANHARGYDTDFTPGSPNFMRIRNVGGQDLSLFGPWDSLVRGIASGDPTYILRTKASPAVALAWDLISGKSFTGEDTRTPEYLARQLLPFSLNQAGEQSLGATAVGATGLKASPLTNTERVQVGDYKSLEGLDQLKASKAEAWRGVSKITPLNVGQYASYYDWRQATEQSLTEHLGKVRRANGQPLSAAEINAEVQKAIMNHPVQKAYSGIHNALEDRWAIANQDEAAKLLDKQAGLPPWEWTFSPSKSVRELIEARRHATPTPKPTSKRIRKTIERDENGRMKAIVEEEEAVPA